MPLAPAANTSSAAEPHSAAPFTVVVTGIQLVVKCASGVAVSAAPIA